MRHLSPDECLGLVEGEDLPAARAHLGDCSACRAQVTALAATLATVEDVEVPEPSPLFWEHFSARVRAAVAAEPVEVSWRARLLSGRSWVLASAVAAVVFAVVLGMSSRSDVPVPGTVTMVTPVVEDAGPASATGDDESLQLLADLASDLDWESSAAAGLTTSEASVDRVVVELSATERVELQKLLAAELAASGRAL